jgi:hypothetical protein
MAQFSPDKLGGSNHTKWSVPAERLEELNAHLVGKIEVIHEFTA